MYTALWVILAGLFVLLAIWHFVQSPKTIDPMKASKRPGGGQVLVRGTDIDQPINQIPAFTDLLPWSIC